MVVKQQPFADAEVVSAVNNNVMRKIPLDHEEFKLYPKLQLKLNTVFLLDIHNQQRLNQYHIIYHYLISNTSLLFRNILDMFHKSNANKK